MKSEHPPYHWITVAVVSAAALFTIGEVWGQSPNASAVFAGRPAMAGAQAGLGAQAGVPQGGIGLQGSDGASLNLRRPRIVQDLEPQNMPQGQFDSVAAAESASTLLPQHDRESYVDEQATRKEQRAAQRTAERAVTGASPIDARDARAVTR
jgi:hypothetical protein